jgi:hypothetical protein
MVLNPIEEHLIGDTVVQILARMDLISEINAVLVGIIKDRPPTLRELVERGLDEAG